jgi:hypothetical protein
MAAPHRALAPLVAALALVAIVSAQTPDPQTLGPKVGERVPDFSLPDQHGAVRTWRSMLGPKGAVLVFYRSADW